MPSTKDALLWLNESADWFYSLSPVTCEIQLCTVSFKVFFWPSCLGSVFVSLDKPSVCYGGGFSRVGFMNARTYSNHNDTFTCYLNLS